MRLGKDGQGKDRFRQVKCMVKQAYRYRRFINDRLGNTWLAFGRLGTGWSIDVLHLQKRYEELNHEYSRTACFLLRNIFNAYFQRNQWEKKTNFDRNTKPRTAEKLRNGSTVIWARRSRGKKWNSCREEKKNNSRATRLGDEWRRGATVAPLCGRYPQTPRSLPPRQLGWALGSAHKPTNSLTSSHGLTESTPHLETNKKLSFFPNPKKTAWNFT